MIKANSTSLSDPTYLHHLLQSRELKLFKELGQKMAVAGKAGTYDSWMFEESDLIQHAAKSFGDRLCAERFAHTLTTCDAELAPVLTQVLHLYLITTLEKNLP